MTLLRSKHSFFYGSMMLLMIVLFRFITIYSAKYAKAQPNINGQYVSDRTWPGCPASQRLTLTILQSGVFLNGSVALQDTAPPTPPTASTTSTPKSTHASTDRPTLVGDWHQPTLTLSGPTTAFTHCTAPHAAAHPIRITGQFTNDTHSAFTGQLTFNGQPQSFTAQRTAIAQPQVEH